MEQEDASTDVMVMVVGVVDGAPKDRGPRHYTFELTVNAIKKVMPQENG